MPFPNWKVVGQNLRTYSKMGVSSYFGESDHGARHIAEMSELRAWLQASMLWNASLDPIVLVDEFLYDFYGEVAHPFVMSHMDGWETGLQGVTNWTNALSHGGFMGCGADSLIHPGNCYLQPWVTPGPVLRSATELTAAITALGSGVQNAPYVQRVEKVLLSSWWIVLMRWEEACTYATEHHLAWPLDRNMTISLADWVDAAARQEIVSLCNSIPGFTAQSYNSTPTAGKVCDPVPVPRPPPAPGTTWWDCHPAMSAQAATLKLKDRDLTSQVKSLVDCQDRCKVIKECIVVNWHGGDSHCHVLMGAASHAAFLAALTPALKTATACFLKLA